MAHRIDGQHAALSQVDATADRIADYLHLQGGSLDEEIRETLSLLISQIGQLKTSFAAGSEERAEGREELRRSNEELEAFAYSVSHDLRAPIRAISGFTRILTEDHGADLAPEASRLLGVIKQNAASMGDLIDDLLDYSRLGRSKAALTPLHTNLLVTELLQELERTIPGERSVEVGELHDCLGDRTLVRQAFTNLFTNAFKFSKDAAPPKVRVHSELAGPFVKYSVSDNGVGFDMRYAPKLFGMFQRLHRSDEFEGTGVGLAIVERVARKHGGEVGAEGAPDQGATFWITFPRRLEG